MTITRTGSTTEDFALGYFAYGLGAAGSLTVDGGSVLNLTASNPGAEPQVVIGDNGGTGTASVTGTGSRLNITANGASGNNAFLVVGGANGTSGSLTVSASGELHLSDTLGAAGSGSTGGADGITVGDGLSTGTFTVDGGSVFVTGTGTFFYVGNNGGDGVADFSNGSVLQLNNSTSSSSDYVGVTVGNGSSSTGVLNFDASSATIAGNGLSEAYTNVGIDTYGSLNLTNGSAYSIVGDQAYSTGMTIGRYAAGLGSVTVVNSAFEIAAIHEIYVNIGQEGGTGLLDVSGGGSVELVSGGATGLNLGGYDPSSAGSGNAWFTSGSILHIATGAQTWLNVGNYGSGSLTFDNATFDADAGTEFYAGIATNGGSGILQFTNFSSATIDANAAFSGLVVGSGTGSYGSMSLTSASDVAVSNSGGDIYLNIGQSSGLGIVNVDNSSFLLSGANSSGFTLGRYAGSNGILTVSNGGQFEISSGNSSYFIIGRDGGFGTMNVVGGTFLVHDTALGLDAGGSVGRGSGTGAQGGLYVAAGGNVAITASHNNAYLNIARDSTTSGTVSVTDSTLTVASTGTVAGHTDTYISVGRDGGTGQLVLDNSTASFTSANGHAGLRIGLDFGTPGGSGTVIVSNGSTVAISGYTSILDVGYSPTASADLQVVSGSVVTVTDSGGTLPGAPAGFGSGFTLGTDNGSIRATALIDGAGSAIQGMDAALIGHSRPLSGNPTGVGNGRLTITNGGLLSAADVIIGTGGSLVMGTGTVAATAGEIWFQDGGGLTVQSSGVASLVGDVTFDPGSAATIEVAADGLHAGTVQHSGGLVSVTDLDIVIEVLGGYRFTAGQTYTLVSSTSPLDLIGNSTVSVTGQDSNFGYAVHENATATAVHFLALNSGNGTGAANLDLGAASTSGATVSYDTAAGRGAFTGGSLNAGEMYNVDGILGTAANDTITVTGSIGLTLNGRGGADHLNGGAGDDVLIGGAGADTLNGGANTAFGDTASYAGSASGVTVNLATGAASGGDAAGDTLSGIENLTGSSQGDTLTGNTGANRLDGGAGDDVLVGGAGADTLIGGSHGANGDRADYSASTGAVTVSLANGTGLGGHAQGDTLTGIENLTGSVHGDTLTGNTGSNRLNGGLGNDVLNGSLGDDFLFGEGDDDTLIGGAGADALDGGTNGAGGDTASYAGSASGVTVNLTTGTGSGGDAQGDTLTGIENLFGSNQGDTLTGNGGANRLDGYGGIDTIDGQGGDDVLIGGAGGDTLIGGTNDAGGDTASYENASGAVAASLAAGGGTLGHAAGDSFSGIENLLGSAYGDVLEGDNNANVLTGYGGGDTLIGLDGADTLDGQAGDDTLIGGAGADYLSGGSGIDTADYSGSAAGVDARVGRTGVGGDAEGDFITTVENITGSAHNDTLVGSSVANVLIGGNGNDSLNGAGSADTLEGGEGNDTLIGGTGGDTLDGGNGIDTAYYYASTVGVQINLAAHTASLGEATGDTLISIENIIGSNVGNDRLTGDAGANTLSGNGGSDFLEGGGGNDWLSGGNDSVQDRFIYSAAGFGNDTIPDFHNGEDIFDLRGLGLTFSDVTATQSGAHTIITLAGHAGDDITLRNFAAADIDATDFWFV